ncbi:hypothetical protein O1611_g761 [Lasiodiplodia mahajangana]|uniref:Uncharacterized protein n=1 Tax=Lasiodiplodia mahajangana TaxID=1108764 RepID=A0ACC2JZ96_9PEZI|nr:hypothetical protein O1611_g761 [Lasiodiplodia mahajangana]
MPLDANRRLTEEILQTDRPHPRPEPKRLYNALCGPTIDEQEQERVSPANQRTGNDGEQQPKRARLTRKNLALFNKTSESTVESSTTKTASTTMSSFIMQASKNGILEPQDSNPPTNLEDLRAQLAKSRETPSPPESVYEDYAYRVERATNEATMVVEVGRKLLKFYTEKGYRQVYNQAFTAFPKYAGLNNGLSAPQPDFVEGLEMKQYRPFLIDEYVNDAVLYKDDPNSLTLPHLAGEWKGSGKNMKEARMQSAYDGAALVYARNQALKFIGKPDPPGHAGVTTFTTDGSSLNVFAHYSTLSEEGDGTLQYHQYPIKSTNLIDSYRGFKAGRRELRNGQDCAKEQSYALRDRLREHWRLHQGSPQSTNKGAPGGEPPGTSINEDEDKSEDQAGYEMAEQSCEPKPPTSLLPVGDYGRSNSAEKRKLSSLEETPRKSSKPNNKGKEF